MSLCKLAFFRVYSGTMNSGSYVLNATKDKKERVGRILQMHANKRAELDKVYSGDIAAAVGFKFTTTGDTICDEQHPVILESMESNKNTSFHGFFNTFAYSRNVFLRNCTTDNSRIEFVCFFTIDIHWFKFNFTVSVLSTSTRLDRQSSPEWVSFTWRLSLTVFFVSSK